MARTFSERHKIGLVRSVTGKASLQAQIATLKTAGVAEQDIWHMGEHRVAEIVGAFRIVPGDDLLVVPFLAVLGSERYTLLKGIAAKCANLYDLEGELELPISQAAIFDHIERAVSDAELVADCTPPMQGAELGARAAAIM